MATMIKSRHRESETKEMDKGGRVDLRCAMGPPAAVMDAGRGQDPIVAINKGLSWFSVRLWQEGVVMHLQVGKGPGYGIGGPVVCREDFHPLH